jgi:hypothetical protein
MNTTNPRPVGADAQEKVATMVTIDQESVDVALLQHVLDVVAA